MADFDDLDVPDNVRHALDSHTDHLHAHIAALEAAGNKLAEEIVCYAGRSPDAACDCPAHEALARWREVRRG